MEGTPNYRQHTKNTRNLIEFIHKYKSLPELWDPTDRNYTKKHNRLAAYRELLLIYRKIKFNATIEDLRRKINIMRSNYKKEWRKIYASNNTYKPLSLQFHELSFLHKLQKQNEPILPDFKIESVEGNVISDDLWELHNGSVNNGSESQYPIEIDDSDDSNEASFPDVKNHQEYESYSPSENQSTEIEDYELSLAKVWAAKLKVLAPEHKLYTEKVINDILFEANIKHLKRQSNANTKFE